MHLHGRETLEPPSFFTSLSSVLPQGEQVGRRALFDVVLRILDGIHTAPCICLLEMGYQCKMSVLYPCFRNTYEEPGPPITGPGVCS